MKLLFNTASPFSRKARILAHEMALGDALEPIDTGLIPPVKPNAEVIAVNPIGKVPVLLLDDGRCLSDSRVICEYLDDVGAGGFFPAAADERYTALHIQALVDDLLNTAVATRYELAYRPAGTLWEEWVEKQKMRISRTLDYFETCLPLFAGRATIGEVAVACALGYVDFRDLDPQWSDRNGGLARWYADYARGPAMQATWPSS